MSPDQSEARERSSVVQADNVLLARLGYKSEFKREFSLLETCCFSLSIMGVVASVASTYSFPLMSGGHVGMVFGWLIPCLFVMTVALSMAELTSAMPFESNLISTFRPLIGLFPTSRTSAGLYYFSAKMAPPKYAALASWITGWSNTVGQIALVCSIDFTCSQMVATAISVGTGNTAILNAGPTYGILCLILLLHGIICSSATQILARINIFYAFMNLGTTIAAIVCLLVLSGDRRVSTKDAFTLFENNTGWSNGGWAFLLAFTAPMWTLTGYDSAAHISEETTGAARAAPIAILFGAGVTASLGWLLQIAASYATTSVSATLQSGLPMPMGQLYLDTLGRKGMLAIWSCIIVVQFVTGAAQGVDASRVVFAFARDGALPGSRWWRKMSSRTQTPINAVWLVMFISALLGLLGFSEAALASLAGASVIGLYTSYTVPIFLRITSGRNRLIHGPFSLGRWYLPIGVIAVAWVSFIIVLLLFPGSQHPTADTMNYAVVLIFPIFLFAAASWTFSAHKWFKGPIHNVDEDNSVHGEKESADEGDINIKDYDKSVQISVQNV